MVTIASVKQHPKIPAFEQELSAAAATQNMLIAAHAQGVGAMWRTGSMACHPLVLQGLGLAVQEKIIGFLYLGTISGPVRSPAVTRCRRILRGVVTMGSRSLDIQCWKCGVELRNLLLPFSRYEECGTCKADLHVCIGCKNYDPLVSDACREDRADFVLDKDKANFCDFFRANTRAYRVIVKSGV